jgi:pyridoxamine 5'-phosphate oxidase
MQTTHIFEIIENWIKEEKELGSTEAGNVILATASSRGEVHSRVVAIKELSEKGILFFTQQRSRKAKDLSENPSASMTFWLPLRKREIVLDGLVKPLENDENKRYWEALPRERQLRFLTYRSGEAIDSLNDLQVDYQMLEKEFNNQEIPVNEKYCGYCFNPHNIYFYTLGQDTFSEAIRYIDCQGIWKKQLISP